MDEVKKQLEQCSLLFKGQHTEEVRVIRNRLDVYAACHRDYIQTRQAFSLNSKAAIRLIAKEKNLTNMLIRIIIEFNELLLKINRELLDKSSGV